MPSAARARNGTICLNNPTDADEIALREFAVNKCKYFIGGREVGESGTPHLQCAFVAKDKIAVSTIHNATPSSFDLKYPIRALTGPNNAFDYCKKGEQPHAEWEESGIKGEHFGDHADIFLEHGEQPNPGQRNDLDKEAIQAHRNWNSVLNDDALTATVARNLNWARQVFDAKPPKPLVNFQPRPWQAALIDTFKGVADDRTIHWAYDPEGGAGKTTLTNFLIRNMGAIILSGKAADMFCAYDMQPIIIIDIPRSMTDDKDGHLLLNYGAIEKLKDGVFFSGKYNPVMKTRDDTAHVIIFSNHLPDESKFTSDRLHMIRLSEPHFPIFM